MFIKLNLTKKQYTAHMKIYVQEFWHVNTIQIDCNLVEMLITAKYFIEIENKHFWKSVKYFLSKSTLIMIIWYML
jgi:hypothetical protein